jgi:hypothetical protein
MDVPCIRSLIQPRLIRLRDAPAFFGMDKNRFNREVRPQLTEIRIGTRGCAFDRLEMYAAADDYKARNGRPAAQSDRSRPWESKGRQGSPSAVGSGTSTSNFEASGFAKTLEQAISQRHRNSSRGESTLSAKSDSLDAELIARSAQPRRNT